MKAPVFYNLKSPLFVVAGGHLVGRAAHDNEPWTSIKITEGYKYEQRHPIPSYLIAFASGDLKSAPIGPRSQVLSGPDEIDGCQWELEGDMEKFLEAAESIVFKYQWKTYNVLVLPSSFPYGGRCFPCNLIMMVSLTVCRNGESNLHFRYSHNY